MDNISLILYSNEEYLPIAYLSSLQINKFVDNNIPKYLATNRFNNLFKFTDFTILDADTPYQPDASHCRNILIKAIESVNSDYILYMQDDYYLIDHLKHDLLPPILKYMREKNIGFFSLFAQPSHFGCVDHDHKLYGLPTIIDLTKSNHYRYALTTQPCIWHKDLLKQIIDHNQYLTLSTFDNYNIRNCQNILNDPNNPIENFWDYNMSIAAFDRDDNTMGNYAFDTHDGISEYYIILYSEIIRNGKFNTSTLNNKIIVDNILTQFNILEDNRYNRFI